MKRTKFSFLLLVLIAFSLDAQEGFDFDENPVPFFDLNITDSYEVVSEKLRGSGYEVIVREVEEEMYRRQITEKYRTEHIFVMWPDNQIIEENMNRNFLLRHIGGQIANFTKFSIPKKEFDILVEIFLSRDDCVTTEDNGFINYEVIISSLRFALQYNPKSGLGTFSYTNSDFFVPWDVWEREEWERAERESKERERQERKEREKEKSEEETGVWGGNGETVDTTDTYNADSEAIPADSENIAANNRKNLTWLFFLLLIPLAILGIFVFKKKRK